MPIGTSYAFNRWRNSLGFPRTSPSNISENESVTTLLSPNGSPQSQASAYSDAVRNGMNIVFRLKLLQSE